MEDTQREHGVRTEESDRVFHERLAEITRARKFETTMDAAFADWPWLPKDLPERRPLVDALRAAALWSDDAPCATYACRGAVLPIVGPNADGSLVFVIHAMIGSRGIPYPNGAATETFAKGDADGFASWIHQCHYGVRVGP